MTHSQSSCSFFFGELRSRELSGFKVRQRPYLGDLLSDTADFIIEHDNNPSPPLSLSFCKDDSQFLTASGDQTIKIWNVEKRRCLGLLTGHTGSVKSVSSHSTNPDLFVSGSRDGSFAIWDLRSKSSSVNSHGVARVMSSLIVKEAHFSSQGRRTRRVKVDSKSVTSVLYLKDDISIASAGAVDSVVKFWDTRNLITSIAQACPDIKSFSKKEKARHGISSLSQDSTGVLLAASCMDNRIYLYDAFHLSKGPKKIFSGSKITSFYVKSAISPDGSHILSGSGDGNAYLWRVNKPESVPVQLEGHEKEVTAVTWCSTEVGKMATSSDDYMVRVWDIKKEKCISTRSPNSMRKRVTATPTKLYSNINMDETQFQLKEMTSEACTSTKMVTNPPSPIKSNTFDFATPKSSSKRKLELFPAEALDMQRTPDSKAAFDSPSSVLNLPSSLRKRTIRDYFVHPHESINIHDCD